MRCLLFVYRSEKINRKSTCAYNLRFYWKRSFVWIKKKQVLMYALLRCIDMNNSMSVLTATTTAAAEHQKYSHWTIPVKCKANAYRTVDIIKSNTMTSRRPYIWSLIDFISCLFFPQLDAVIFLINISKVNWLKCLPERFIFKINRHSSWNWWFLLFNHLD